MGDRMDDDYYGERLGEDPLVEVKLIKDKGKGMVMRRGVKKGDIIYRDVPLVSLQHLPNQAIAPSCHYCHSAVGSVEEHLSALSGVQLEKPLLRDSFFSLAPVIECYSRCGVRYCSEACRDLASDQHHLLLCTGSLESDTHALVAFKLFSLAHNEIFLLAARLVCRVIRFSHIAGEFTLHPFSLLRSLPWSEAVVYREPCPEEEHSHTDEDDEDMFRSALSAEELEAQSAEAFGLLKDALLSTEIAMRDPELAITIADCLEEGRVDEAFFSRCIGMFETNCTSIEHTHPLGQFLRQATPEDDDTQKKLLARLWEITEDIEEDEEDDDGEDEETVPLKLTEDAICSLEDRVCSGDFEGIGVYDVVAVMNHSCTPNCEVSFTDSFAAFVEATRDIEAGEELCHSYIEDYEDMDAHQRAEILQCWGFQCTCERCKRGE